MRRRAYQNLVLISDDRPPYACGDPADAVSSIASALKNRLTYRISISEYSVMDNTITDSLTINKKARTILIVFAILAFLGPNGLYLYYAFSQPELSDAAMNNPIALAFMIEAIMLLVLFLWYVFNQTRSWMQVLLYLGLSFLGSLAFSFPLFLYKASRK